MRVLAMFRKKREDVLRSAAGDIVNEYECLPGAHILISHAGVFFLSRCIQ